MTDDIRALTARLADEPNSLAFLELGETLRRRGQLDTALKVARGGASRYPGLADAHDLLARILCDRDDLPSAFEAWADALRLDPLHPAALKGIAFLYFRSGDAVAARDYLERALEADPDDATIPAALARIAGASPAIVSSNAVSPNAVSSNALSPDAVTPVSAPAPAAGATQPDGDGAIDGKTLLVDASGMRLRGTLTDTAAHDVSDAVAAQLAGVSKEAARAARLLELGTWESIAVESPDGHFVLVAPTGDTVLLASAADMPMARLALLADRAARDARGWLERER